MDNKWCGNAIIYKNTTRNMCKTGKFENKENVFGWLVNKEGQMKVLKPFGWNAPICLSLQNIMKLDVTT